MMYLDLQELYDEMTALEESVEAWAASTAEERAAGDVEYPGLEDISRFEELRELFDEIGEDAKDESAIEKSYFEEYAQELAEDIGAIDRDASWPLYCIDWEQAARGLAMDYTEFDFDGGTYLVRSC